MRLFLLTKIRTNSLIRMIVVVIARNAQFMKTKIVNQVRNITATTPMILLTISNSTAVIILNESSNFNVTNLTTKTTYALQ